MIDLQISRESIPGITPKVLAKELKELERHQLVTGIITENYPVKISYKTTTHSKTLWPVIYTLKDWRLNHRKKIFNHEPN
jgi:DNA-binding HxlR family transcriptional regulator